MSRRNRNQHRRGAALILALVCIFLLGVLLTTVLRFTMLRYKASTLQVDRAQATCLADAGLRRAAARLAADPDYQGETWALTPESLQGKYGAAVIIAVKPGDKENTRLVTATADYPKDPAKRRARVSKEITIKLLPSKNQET